MNEGIQRAAESNFSFGMAVVSILFFLFGVVVAEHLGEQLAEKCVEKRDYVLANVAWFLGGVIVSALVFATGWILFAAITIGMIAGGIAGLKIGFGESVGPWKFIDRQFKANDSHLKAAKDPQSSRDRRAARRERKRTGAPEPELMSVAPRVEEPGDVRDAGSKKHSKGTSKR